MLAGGQRGGDEQVEPVVLADVEVFFFEEKTGQGVVVVVRGGDRDADAAEDFVAGVFDADT